MKMDRETALAQLKDAQENYDTEWAHEEADQVLCSLLAALGYEDVVREWTKVSKWYA